MKVNKVIPIVAIGIAHQVQYVQAQPIVSARFLEGLSWVESRHNAEAKGDKDAAGVPHSFGCMQISMGYMRECNRILGAYVFGPDATMDRKASREMVRVHLTYWSKRFSRRGWHMGPQQLLALHRWGPTQYKPNCIFNEVDVNRWKVYQEYMQRHYPE